MFNDGIYDEKEYGRERDRIVDCMISAALFTALARIVVDSLEVLLWVFLSIYFVFVISGFVREPRARSYVELCCGLLHVAGGALALIISFLVVTAAGARYYGVLIAVGFFAIAFWKMQAYASLRKAAR